MLSRITYQVETSRGLTMRLVFSDSGIGTEWPDPDDYIPGDDDLMPVFNPDRPEWHDPEFTPEER